MHSHGVAPAASFTPLPCAWPGWPAWAATALAVAWATLTADAAIQPAGDPDYDALLPRLELAVAGELHRRDLTACSIALVDDQDLVFLKGYGFADRDRGTPARSDTVYRAGSISKVLTALAAMRLAIVA